MREWRDGHKYFTIWEQAAMAIDVCDDDEVLSELAIGIAENYAETQRIAPAREEPVAREALRPELRSPLGDHLQSDPAGTSNLPYRSEVREPTIGMQSM